MHIVIVCQYFAPETFRVNDLAEELAARGNEVTVLTGMPNYPQGAVFDAYRARRFRVVRERYAGSVDVVRFPLVPRGSSSKVRLALNYVSFASVASLLTPFVLRKKRNEIDAVIIYQLSPILMALPGVVASRRTKAPLIHWIMDLWPESASEVGQLSGRLSRSLERIVRFIYEDAAHILVQSRGFERSVRSRCAPGKLVSYLPSWGEDFLLDDPDRSIELPGDGFKVVFAGNVGDAQGLDTMVEAAGIAKERGARIDWVIVGSGRALPAIQEAVKTANLSDTVHFLARRPLEEMPALFGAADALYVGLRGGGSVGATIPSKVQAYLAAGRPILAALDGEAAELVSKAGAGIGVKPDDAVALAEAAMVLGGYAASDLNTMGEAGRRYYRAHFLKATIVDELVAHVHNAIGTNNNSR